MALTAPKYDMGIDAPRAQTEAEEKIVSESLKEFSQLQSWRSTFASHWEEVAELILPTSKNTFYYGNFNWPGAKKTERMIDATGMLALERFTAICDSLITPRNQTWHTIGADDPYVMKDRQTALWFEEAGKRLFKQRYKGTAGFPAANTNDWTELGAFGTAGLFVDQLDVRLSHGQKGLRYKHIPLGQMFLRMNHQNICDGMIYWFKYSANQALQEYGPENFPAMLRPALEQKSEMTFDFIQRICPKYDYDPTRMDFAGMPFSSYHICMASRTLLREGGYRSLPIIPSRYNQTPGEIYGRSPAMSVLPALKTINAEKATYLKVGHQEADPTLLSADDGVIDVDRRPGTVIKGGIDSQGRELVKRLQGGDFKVSEKMIEMEASLINDAFLVTLFQILVKTPQMSATEVIERMNEKGILLAPALGRQFSERIEPLVARELDLLGQMGLLPPMPPRLKEARGEYQVVATGPLAKLARAQESAGFMRTLETVKELVAITQDTSLLDPFNFTVAVPAIAENQSVPASWMATKEEIAQKGKARAQAQAKDQAIKALPNQAAMVSAQAKAEIAHSKSGQQPQQQQQQQGPQPQPHPQGQLPAQAGPPLDQ